jgi:hypothetical protein
MADRCPGGITKCSATPVTQPSWLHARICNASLQTVTNRYKPLQTVTNPHRKETEMDTIQMTEKDAERWETIVRLHSDDYADADDFWLEGIDELCSAFQPNKCDGCPVKSFTGRAYCGGNRHWRLWAYTIDAYLALKEENEGHELGPILNEIAAKAAGEHGRVLATLAKYAEIVRSRKGATGPRGDHWVSK